MTSPLGLRPTKIIAVHLNYPSRVAEFGASTPPCASYFLKPPSALAGSGDPVIRPQGCRYLNYEGEIAVVIGERARNISLEDSLRCVRGYTLADDFGVHDFRHADSGSMLRVKGQDGFCPIGPALAAADSVDPEELEFRTLVNGTVVQRGNSRELLFSVRYLIADLARLMTLEPDDLILTGTPANSRPVQPGDLVTVECDLIGRLENRVEESPIALLDVGAMPVDGHSAKEVALGRSVPELAR